MLIDILSLFPDLFPAYLETSIVGRAIAGGQLRVRLHNIRDFAEGRHHITDEPPYGGGGGMILKAGPIFRATEHVQAQESSAEAPPIILLSPQGRPFAQDVAMELSTREWLILLCGRYEGVDERVRQHLITDEISIGDYVLTGGELPALVMVDAITRLLPGALGAEQAAASDSHAQGLLEGPHYTRPASFRGWDVPDVVRSGHAANLARWRRQESLRRTWQRRPDLLRRANLSDEDRAFLEQLAEGGVEAAELADD